LSNLVGREVRFSDWTKNEETGSHELKEIGKGYFQGFGLEVESDFTGSASYTVAIILMEDGKIRTALPENMVVIDQENLFKRQNIFREYHEQ